jgi:hypothetical protein
MEFLDTEYDYNSRRVRTERTTMVSNFRDSHEWFRSLYNRQKLSD